MFSKILHWSCEMLITFPCFFCCFCFDFNIVNFLFVHGSVLILFAYKKENDKALSMNVHLFVSWNIEKNIFLFVNLFTVCNITVTVSHHKHGDRKYSDKII